MMENEKITDPAASKPAGNTAENTAGKNAADSAAGKNTAEHAAGKQPAPAADHTAANEQAAAKTAAAPDHAAEPRSASRPRRRSGRGGRSGEGAAAQASSSDRQAAAQSPAATQPQHPAQSPARPAAAKQPADRKQDPASGQSDARKQTDARKESDGRRQSDGPKQSDARKRSGASGQSRGGRQAAAAKMPAPDRTFVPTRPAPSKLADKPRNKERTKTPGGTMRWTWRDYLMQLSVVVIGVMVTFIGSGLVSRWRQAREVRTVMQLVYEELKTNRANIERTCRELEHERRGIVMMQEYGLDYTRVPIDSLEKYRFILAQMPDFTPQSDALEMLRSSGTMIAVNDKQLLFEVLGCYTGVNSFAASVESYNNQKMSALNHLFANGTDFTVGGSDPRASWKSMMEDPMCAAFIGVMGNFFGRDVLNGGAVAVVDRVTEALDEKYGFE